MDTLEMMPETKTNDAPRQRLEDDPMSVRDEDLEARHEPFDSYWQGPADLEKGYGSFGVYYRYNVMPYIPKDKSASILVVSCGPGYLVKLLKDDGYEHVIGIDSDPEKVAHGQKRGLDCRAEKAFGFIKRYENEFDVVVCEQELNHLTQAESIAFLRLCHRAMRPGATLFAYGLNGANPIVGAENLAHNIDHFSTYAEHSIKQVIELSGFRDVKPMPLKLYVFWKNPLNYVGLAVTGTLELWYRVIFKMYGKNCKIFSKKIAAVAKK